MQKCKRNFRKNGDNRARERKKQLATNDNSMVGREGAVWTLRTVPVGKHFTWVRRWAKGYMCVLSHLYIYFSVHVYIPGAPWDLLGHVEMRVLSRRWKSSARRNPSSHIPSLSPLTIRARISSYTHTHIYIYRTYIVSSFRLSWEIALGVCLKSRPSWLRVFSLLKRDRRPGNGSMDIRVYSAQPQAKCGRLDSLRHPVKRTLLRGMFAPSGEALQDVRWSTPAEQR